MASRTTTSYRVLRRHGLLFFAYGALLHALMLRLALVRSYGAGPPHPPLFVRAFHATVITAGGLSVAAFFVALLARNRAVPRKPAWRTLARGGFYGVGATILTVAVSCFSAAVIEVIHIPPAAGEHTLQSLWLGPLLVLLATVDLGTYALASTIPWLPFAFLYGVAGGAYVLLVGRRTPPETALAEPMPPLPNPSLTFAILGALLFGIPLIGFALGLLAVAYGVRSGAWRRRAKRCLASRAGTVIGAICIVASLSPYLFHWSAGPGR